MPSVVRSTYPSRVCSSSLCESIRPDSQISVLLTVPGIPLTSSVRLVTSSGMTAIRRMITIANIRATESRMAGSRFMCSFSSSRLHRG